MTAKLRVAAICVALLTPLLLSAASAEAASFFKRHSGKTSIEVHVDERRILYLHLDAPIHCTGGSSFVEEIADSRRTIRIVRETGAFSFVDVYRNGDEYAKAVVKGVIRRGRLDGEYRFVHVLGNGDSCWSGESIQGPAEAPEGSAVALSVSRQRGVRFFKDFRPPFRRSADTYAPGSFSPRVYMWIGGGKVYGLTAIVPERCVTRQAGFPPSTNHFDLVLARRRVVPVNPRTHQIHVREVRRTGPDPGDRQVWELTATAERDRVSGHLSHTYDYTYAGGDKLHCQTGGRGSPRIDFDALHG